MEIIRKIRLCQSLNIYVLKANKTFCCFQNNFSLPDGFELEYHKKKEIHLYEETCKVVAI